MARRKAAPKPAPKPAQAPKRKVKIGARMLGPLHGAPTDVETLHQQIAKIIDSLQPDFEEDGERTRLRTIAQGRLELAYMSARKCIEYEQPA